MENSEKPLTGGPGPGSPVQIGGQAVLEGVMMRAPGMVATAVRRSNGEIVVKKHPHLTLGERYPVFKLPVLRGAVGLVEMLVISMRTLNFSAEVAMLDLHEADGESSMPLKKEGGTGQSRRDTLMLGATVTLALGIGVALFFVTPLLIATFFFKVDQSPLQFNLVAGTIRVLFLLSYLAALLLFKDIRRLFQYHGAEHMAVFAFEKGCGLDVGSAEKQSRFHPRCGTSFLLIVMIASVLLFSILDALLIYWLGRLTLATRLVAHVSLVPIVGGMAYEVIKVSARRSATIAGKLMAAPGLWLQRITTRPPDASQLEVALVALRCALGDECASHSPVRLLAKSEGPTIESYA